MDIISFGLASKVSKALEALIGNSKLTIPSGTTAERPTLGVGDKAIRFNTDTSGLEEWDGTEWKNISATISAVALKGTDTASNILAMVGMVAEDLWIASDTLDGYVYDGSVWINLGPLKGDTGNGIASVALTNTVGNTKTYTITFTDTSTTTFDVVDGVNGVNGQDVDHMSRTSGTGAAGTTDTYTVWLDAGETISAGTFSVYNGADGLGAGDMVKSIYDPTNINASVFDTDNHISGTTNKVYTATEQTKLSGIAEGAQVNDANTTLQGNTFNGVSQLVQTDGTGKLPAIDGSQLTNMPVALPSQTGFAGKYLKTDGTDATWEDAQEVLVSGTNIKTVGGQSLLGSGDVEISSSSTLSELTDVSITTPDIGNALVWSGSKWVPSNNVLEIKPIQYGLQWNNTADTYTRLGAAVGWTTGADFNNNVTVQSRMRRCVLNTDGTVNYYLDANDSTLKEDGVTAAVLDGTDGNVMVEIPKFWVKYDNTTSAKQMWISTSPAVGYVVHPAFVKNGVEVDYRYYRAYKGSVSGDNLISRSGVAAASNETIAAFRTKAQANGTGWGLVDWHLLFAVQTLLFIEIGTFNSQAVLGNGNDTGSDYGMTTGGSNSIGNASSPSINDDTWMSYRGIENFYADIYEWIDGINISIRLVYTSNTQSTFASDVFSDAYTSTVVTLPFSGYISDMDFSIKGFIPTVATGSDSTYVTDYVTSFPGARVAAFGGDAGMGLKCGAAFLHAGYASSVAVIAFGAGLSF